jgi:hypothetical protein
MGRPKGSTNKDTGISNYKEKSKDEIFINQLVYQFRRCSIINYNLMNKDNLEKRIARLIKEYKNEM